MSLLCHALMMVHVLYTRVYDLECFCPKISPFTSYPKCSASACYTTMSVAHPPNHYKLNLRRELSQFVSDHILRNRHMGVVSTIVNLELQPHKVGQDRRRSGLRSHGGHLVVGVLGPDDGKARIELEYCECRRYRRSFGRGLTARDVGL